MIELPSRADRLPLQLASRLLNAPGTWSPDSGLETGELGAIVTPPLGWEWDGQAMGWESYPGSFVWAPPRRPLERFLRRLGRKKVAELPLFTIAPDVPERIEEALAVLEAQPASGYLLWEATPENVAAARRGGLALPIIAEITCTAAATRAEPLVEAGADALWIGPPPVGRDGRRLWGPAILPLLLAALETGPLQALAVPLIAGAGCSTAADAQRLREAGAAVVALDPTWWVEPALAAVVAATLQQAGSTR